VATVSHLVNLDRIARELGITAEQAAEHLREAMEAGLLRVVAADDDTVTLQGVTPEDDLGGGDGTGHDHAAGDPAVIPSLSSRYGVTLSPRRGDQ
jgi:hypothetical protein